MTMTGGVTLVRRGIQVAVMSCVIATIPITDARAGTIVDVDLGALGLWPQGSSLRGFYSPDATLSLGIGGEISDDIALVGRGWVAAVGGDPAGGLSLRAEYPIVRGRVYAALGAGLARASLSGGFPGQDSDYMEAASGPSGEAQLRYFFSPENRGEGVSLSFTAQAVPYVVDSRFVESYYSVVVSLGYRWLPR